MRVMWLTQLQLPAATGAPSMAAAGWLEGLRWALETYQPDIELHIVSWGASTHAPRSSGRTTFHSLKAPRPSTRLQRITTAWSLAMIPPEAIDDAVAIGRRLKPDLVHLHGTEHPLGLAALRLGRPTVATLQGIANALQRYVLGPVPPAEIARGIVTRNFVRGSSFLHWHFGMRRAAATERTIIEGLHYFMGQTDWDREVLRLLNPTAEYFRGPRVVQPAYYGKPWQGPLTDETVIFCTSSPAPYKGLETVLEALALLRDAGLVRARLRVAGDIRDSLLWPWLEGLVKKWGLEGRVTWLGPLPSEELATELRRASLFVLPSHIENESNALIEAMLVGLPCVAAAVGGVPSVIRHGMDGLLFHDSDPFSLAAAIARVADDPEMARSLGAAARDGSKARWDPRTGAQNVRAIYDHVVSTVGGGVTPRPSPPPAGTESHSERKVSGA
jgi:glycosyltransferase involved in cell wall biosynthesis